MPSIVRIGDRVGPYRLVSVLGEGAAATVYRAAWEPDAVQRREAPDDHPDEVALKLLRSVHAGSEELFRRFVREIGVAQNIHHPHLVRHLDSGLDQDFLYYAMELLTFGPLREVLHRRGALPWRDATECALHIADALGALHQAGVVHRDVKPENIFLSSSGGLKLGDFGLARVKGSPQLTVVGETVGSIRYMAPEQVCGAEDLDGRCDFYALGCVLFEMLTARPPFQSTDVFRVFQQHVEEPPPRVVDLSPTVPTPVGELVDRLLRKDRLERPSDASELCGAFARLLALDEHESVAETSPSDAIPGRSDSAQRRIESTPSQQPPAVSPGPKSDLVQRLAGSTPTLSRTARRIVLFVAAVILVVCVVSAAVTTLR